MKSNIEAIIESDLPHQLAREHWLWQRKLLKEVCDVPDSELNKYERIAIDYFLHGYKHGQEEVSDVK